MPKPEPLAFAERVAVEVPIAVARQEPVSIAGHDSDSGSDPDSVSGHDPVTVTVTGREPDSVADQVPLAGQLPEEAVAVRLDDVRQRHRDLPVGRAAGAHAHLDDV